MLLIPLSANAQFTLRGKITDEKGAPVNGAYVYLYHKGDMAALANSSSNGEYSLTKVPKGTYDMVVSFVGYKEKDKTITVDRDLTLNFILETDNVMLEKVVVEGKRIQTTSKGHVFYLSEKAKESKNPYKALQEIPLIFSDPVNETVRSVDGESMAILIDGMRVNSGISPIDPARIKSVEIVDVVGARYMRQGIKKVMNIKLKKSMDLYTYAQLQGQAYYPRQDYYFGPKFEIGNSRFSVYGSASGDFSETKTSHGYDLSSSGLSRNYSGESTGKDKDFYFSFMSKWRITEKDYLAAYVQGDFDKAKDDNKSFGSQEGKDMVRTARTDYKSDIFSATAYFKHLFSEDQELEAYAVYSDNRADNTNKLSEEIGGNDGLNIQKYINDMKSVKGTLTYSQDFENGGSLELGDETEYLYDKIDNTGISSYLYRHHRLNEYFYAGYSGRIGRKLTYNTTAGMEYVSMRSDTIRHSYFKPRVSLGLYYNILEELRTSINYSYRNSAPSVEMLNPYNTSADTLLVRHGNPHLLPSQTHAFTWNAGYMKSGLYLEPSVSYSISSDIVKPVSIAQDNGVLLTTYRNEGRFRALALQLQVLWRKKGYFFILNTSHNVSYYTESGAKKYFNGMMFLSKDWGKFNARISLTYQNYEYTEYSRTKNDRPSSTLVLTYSFTPDLVLSLGCDNIFGNVKKETMIATGQYRSVSFTTEKTFTPWIQLRWSMRKNESKKIDLDNDIIKDPEERIKL